MKQFSAIVLLGDFNAHYNFTDTMSLNTDIGIRLFNFLECNNLFQLVDEPTRITALGESILDLIITDAPGYFVSSGTLSPPANCDHNFIFAKLSISSRKPKAFKRVIRDFKNVNISELNKALMQARWDDTSNDIDAVFSNWFTVFSGILDNFIPQRTVTIRRKDKMWMNGSICRAIRRRDHLLKLFSRHRSTVKWENYRKQRNYVISLIRSTKEFSDKLASSLSIPTISPKKWWSYANSLQGNKNCLSMPALLENGHCISDPKEKTEVFNDFFISQTRLPDSASAIVPVFAQFSNLSLSSIVVTEHNVYALLYFFFSFILTICPKEFRPIVFYLQMILFC